MTDINTFSTRAMTTSINSIVAPEAVIYNRYFKGKGRMEDTDSLEFDVITGSQGILPNLSIYAASTVRDKTDRKTITMKAPRIAEKRHLPAADQNNTRAFGSQFATERMREKVAREQMDLMYEFARTWEFQAVGALKGKIYDSDAKTLLMDYNLPADHRVKLLTTERFGQTDTSILTTLFRRWQQKIKDDSSSNIVRFEAWCGSDAYSNILLNAEILALLAPTRKEGTATIGFASDVIRTEIMEYNGSYLAGDGKTGTRTRYIGADELVLVGFTNDMFDLPYAPILDLEAPNGVGNVIAGGRRVPVSSKSWYEKDPSGLWIQGESRQLPVNKRPHNVMVIQTNG